MTPAGESLTGRSLDVYSLGELLGKGGMAEVYRALDRTLQREVAVKVLPASLASDPGYVQRFRDEARQVAALNQPHIVPVYHFGEEQGLLFLVMPILKESLRDWLDREKRLAPVEAARIGVQIASALHAAHTHGLVHRDVKPENILLDDEGQASLTDFGIAREASFLKATGANRTLSATGLPVGTPEYMAPEQLRGAIVDQRADIYALGVVLYELLTGDVPFEAETPYEVAALSLTAPIPSPSAKNPAIGPVLEQTLLRALDKDPDKRFADVKSFATALRAAVVGEQTTAPIPAIRWTQYTGPITAEQLAAETNRQNTQRKALVGQEGQAGRVAGAPTASIPVTTAATAAATTAVLAAIAAPSKSQGDATSRSRGARRWLLVSVALVLALATLAGGGTLAAITGYLPFGVAGVSSLPPLGNGAQSTTGATVTAQTQATQTATAIAGGGSSAAATALATAQGTPAATVTIQPSPSATTDPTATATPVPRLTINPTVIFWQKQKHGRCDDSSDMLTIANNSSQTLSWQWSSSNPPLPGGPGGIQYSINGGSTQSGMPQDSSEPAGQTDSVSFSMPCNMVTTYNVSISDSAGNSYGYQINIYDGD
ncbi:MAG: serine/threonine-protein kinase [Ktedonobacterales bacterium]